MTDLITPRTRRPGPCRLRQGGRDSAEWREVAGRRPGATDLEGF